MSHGWGATSAYWWKIGDLAPTRAGWPKISHRRGRSPSNILLAIKLHWIIFCMVHTSGKISLPFCHNARVWQTDRQTDRQHSHRKSAVKMCPALSTTSGRNEFSWHKLWQFSTLTEEERPLQFLRFLIPTTKPENYAFLAYYDDRKSCTIHSRPTIIVL